MMTAGLFIRFLRSLLTLRTAALLVATIGIFTAVVVVFDNEIPVPPRDLQRIAADMVTLCADEERHEICYDREIPKLMDQGYTMEEAFEVTRIVQRRDPTYQYCHVLGHYLSAKETAKDPSKWKDVVARAPLGICSNGGVHGAFQERFRVESLSDWPLDEIEAELDGVCEPRDGWQPTRMGQATCVHALGHLTMYVTNGDITSSVDLCGRLIPEPERSSVKQLCLDGAFMQIYQPLEPEDYALIAGKEIESVEESERFCEQFIGEAKGSCISESWPLYDGAIKDPERIADICARASFDPWQAERCMNGVFYVAMAQANLSVEWAADFCSRIDESYRGTCFGNSASRLIEVDSSNIKKALGLCEQAGAVGADGFCYNELLKYSGYTFLVGSKEFYELCEGLPAALSQLCLDQTSVERI